MQGRKGSAEASFELQLARLKAQTQEQWPQGCGFCSCIKGMVAFYMPEPFDRISMVL